MKEEEVGVWRQHLAHFRPWAGEKEQVNGWTARRETETAALDTPVHLRASLIIYDRAAGVNIASKTKPTSALRLQTRQATY